MWSNVTQYCNVLFELYYEPVHTYYMILTVTCDPIVCSDDVYGQNANDLDVNIIYMMPMTISSLSNPSTI